MEGGGAKRGVRAMMVRACGLGGGAKGGVGAGRGVGEERRAGRPGTRPPPPPCRRGAAVRVEPLQQLLLVGRAQRDPRPAQRAREPRKPDTQASRKHTQPHTHTHPDEQTTKTKLEKIVKKCPI